LYSVRIVTEITRKITMNWPQLMKMNYFLVFSAAFSSL
jgi:hypothetical protein